MKGLPGVEVRRRAALALHEVRFAGASMRAALPEQLRGLADSRDRALCEAIVFEGSRWMHRYERLLSVLLTTPLGHKQSKIHALLLVGLAQLDALQLAPHAAISASAEAARSLKLPGMVGLVNAVLRRFDRERESLSAQLQDDAGFRYSHPNWMLKAFSQAWPDDWPAIVDANNQAGPLWLRVNLQRVTMEDYQRRLQDQGLETDRHPHLPAGLCLRQRTVPTELPGWDRGWVSVQDAAAQAVVAALAAQPGQRVLDACVAPGGKTAALLESEPSLQVLGLDSAAERVSRTRQSLQRLQLQADIRTADATQVQAWWDGQPFQRILIDAPCSASGVIRRQPDIKWHRRADDVAGLCAQQTALLQQLWPLLAPGGRLLYTTCSVLPQENTEQVAAFLATRDDARVVELPAWLGRAAGAGRQRLPGEQAMDGFFYAAVEKLG